jgi:hypothetical protein
MVDKFNAGLWYDWEIAGINEISLGEVKEDQ